MELRRLRTAPRLMGRLRVDDVRPACAAREGRRGPAVSTRWPMTSG
jgi:hypothetical protein